jgi:hypothetical protein
LHPRFSAAGPSTTILSSTITGNSPQTSAGGIMVPTQNLTVQAPVSLTTTVMRKKGRFILQVLNNGQLVQQFTFNSQPIVQSRDLNGDGINDLVINLKKGKKLMVVAAFSGATAQRLV